MKKIIAMMLSFLIIVATLPTHTFANNNQPEPTPSDDLTTFEGECPEGTPPNELRCADKFLWGCRSGLVYFKRCLFGCKSGACLPPDADPINYGEALSDEGYIYTQDGCEGLEENIPICEETSEIGITLYTKSKICVDNKVYVSECPPTLCDPSAGICNELRYKIKNIDLSAPIGEEQPPEEEQLAEPQNSVGIRCDEPGVEAGVGEVCKDDGVYQLFVECIEGWWQISGEIESDDPNCPEDLGECDPYTERHRQKGEEGAALCEARGWGPEIWEKCRNGVWVEYPTDTPCGTNPYFPREMMMQKLPGVEAAEAETLVITPNILEEDKMVPELLDIYQGEGLTSTEDIFKGVIYGGLEIDSITTADNTNQYLLYMPFSIIEYQVKLTGGEPNSNVLLMTYLIDIDADEVFLISTADVTLDASGGSTYQGSLTPLMSGTYHLIVTVFQEEWKEDAKYWRVGSENGWLMILSDFSQMSEADVDELTNLFIDMMNARYERGVESSQYKEAFRAFMESYIKATYSNVTEMNIALSLLDDSRIEQTIQNMEAGLKQLRIEFALESGLQSADLLYNLVSEAYDSFKNWGIHLSEGGIYMWLIALCLETYTNNFKTRLDRTGEVRDAFALLKAGVENSANYDEVYDAVTSKKSCSEVKETIKLDSFKDGDCEKLSYVLNEYFSHEMFKAIRDDDFPLFLLEIGGFYQITAMTLFIMVEKKEDVGLCDAGLPTISTATKYQQEMVRYAIDIFYGYKKLYPNHKDVSKADELIDISKSYLNKLGWSKGITFVADAALYTIMAWGAGAAAGAAAAAVSETFAAVFSLVEAGVNVFFLAMFTIQGVQTIGGCIAYWELMASADEAEKAKYGGSGQWFEHCGSKITVTIIYAAPIAHSIRKAGGFKAYVRDLVDSFRNPFRVLFRKQVVTEAEGRGVRLAEEVERPSVAEEAVAPEAELVNPQEAIINYQEGVSGDINRISRSKLRPENKYSELNHKLSEIEEVQAYLRRQGFETEARSLEPLKQRVQTEINTVSKSIIAQAPTIKSSESNYFTEGYHVPNEDAFVIRAVARDISVDAVFDGVSTARGAESSKILKDYFSNSRVENVEDVRYLLNLADSEISRISGGSTAAIAYRQGNKLYAVDVGDSYIYRIRGGQVKVLSFDTSEGPNLQGKYIGSGQAVNQLHIEEFTIQPGDRIVIASDGLSDVASEAQIASIVSRASNSQQAVNNLKATFLGKKYDDFTVLARFFH